MSDYSILAILLLLGILGFCAFMYNKHTKQKGNCFNRKSQGRSDKAMPLGALALEDWFNGEVLKFEDEMLSYQIGKLSLDDCISFNTRNELLKQYGNTVVIPSFYIFESFFEKSNDGDLLDSIMKKWLEDKGEGGTSDDLKRKIEDVVKESMTVKAKAIISSILES